MRGGLRWRNLSSVGLAALVIASGSTPPPEGDPPINLDLPQILGTPTDGTAWTLDLGEWANMGLSDTFQISVWTVEGSPVELLPLQTVTADTTGNISGAVGKSIELRVFATNADGTTQATSAAFGPVAAAGDTFVLGLAINTAEQGLPSSPYQFTNVTGANTRDAVVKHGATVLPSGVSGALYPVANPNPGMSGLNFGWNGSSDTAGTGTIASATFADNRLKGRLSANINQSQGRLRIDLPGAGVYRIYAGLGVSGSTANVNMGIWDGTAGSGGVSLHQMGPVSDTDSGVSVVDVNGNVTPIATWAAGAGPGMGGFVEVTVGAGAFITIAKSTNASTSTPNICAIAVFKKAA